MMAIGIVIRAPPPTPCTPRKRISCSIDWLRPARAEPIMKTTIPNWNTRLRP
jgi:hypothetical protein